MWARAAAYARATSSRVAAQTAANVNAAIATPKLSVVQHSGAAVILLGYYETDLMMLRLYTVSGLLCYSVVPNAARGNVLLAAWARRGVLLGGRRGRNL